MKREHLEDYVTTIPDFPQPGIMFRDITSLVQDPDGLQDAIDGLLAAVKDVEFDTVVGLESRGFIFGTALAYALHKGFVLVRKKGKLPRETVSVKYSLEYGEAELELHKDAIHPGEKVLVIDDLLATGGSLDAACQLVESLGGEVAQLAVVMELAGLRGRDKLSKYKVASLITYPGA